MLPIQILCVARPVLFAHLPQRHVQETPTAQGKQGLRYGEGGEAVEGRPGTHILFIALSDGSTQSTGRQSHTGQAP